MRDTLETLRARAAEIRANTVSRKSRQSYEATWTRFLSWLIDMIPERLTQAFKDAVMAQDCSDLRQCVRHCIAADVDRMCPPILFAELQADDFIQWLLSLRKGDGSECGYSSYNSHRAALFNLFREYKCVMSLTLQSELSTYFRGLKRTVAERTAGGALRVKVGKDPLSFELYTAICDATLAMDAKEAVFVRTFLVVTWNLMCRSSNTVSILYDHVEWRGDALRVFFAHMKNDQMGERPRDPRHIYANPLRPSLCPALALGIYWASFSTSGTCTQLFPGSSQYDRFRKHLAVLLTLEPLASTLVRMSIDPGDVGTHSIRKGAATYCSSGSTACPSATAIHLRAGWSLGGVQNTYLRYEAAGDMHVGRTVAGLPQNSERFAVLPPHFATVDDEVEDGLKLAFGHVPPNLRHVLEFALASLAYHYSYLCEVLPPRHPLRQSPIFSRVLIMERLRARVVCGLEKDCNGMTASGIPPHCTLLGKMQKVEDSVKQFQCTVVGEIVAGVESTIADRGGVSRSMLESIIIASIERTGLPALAATLQRPQTEERQPDIDTSDDGSRTMLYHWDGRFRRLPREYTLAAGTPRQMWSMWVCGSPDDRLPPLRFVESCDIADPNTRKGFSDLRFLTGLLEDAAALKGLTVRRLGVVDACKVFDTIESAISLAPSTRATRVRRSSQLSWRTVVNELRRSRQSPTHSQSQVAEVTSVT